MLEKKILVVDDEEAIRCVIKEAFTALGYNVSTAESAEEALDILEAERILVIFLDLNLTGMNGVDLCKEIKSHQPINCVYAMTGYTSLFELVECCEAGFDDYFPKPLDLDVLFKAADVGFEKLNRWWKYNKSQE